MNRREFSAAVQVAIIRRATIDGKLYCEKCEAWIKKRSGGEVHHVKQDAMEVDKASRLKASDGLFLCVPCHREESGAQARVYARVLRVEASHVGARAASRPIPSRAKAERIPRPVAPGRGEIGRRYVTK